MLNTNKIKQVMEMKRVSKSKLCSETGIARTTLDAILNGSDAKVSTIEAIAKVLGIKVGSLFEEESTGISQATYGDFSPAAGRSRRRAAFYNPIRLV